MKARGYYAVGIYGGKTPDNTGTLWRTAHALGAAFVFTVGCRYLRHHRTDTTKATLSVPLWHFTSLAELQAVSPEHCDLIGVELTDTATPIHRFSHPEQAIYLLGAEDRGLPHDVMQACRRVIVLPGSYCHNVAVAGAMVMFDRVSKGMR